MTNIYKEDKMCTIMSFTQREGCFESPHTVKKLSNMIEDELHITPSGMSEDIDKVTFIFDSDLDYREMNMIRDIMNRMEYTEI